MSQEKAERKRYEEDLKLKTAEEPGVKKVQNRHMGQKNSVSQEVAPQSVQESGEIYTEQQKRNILCRQILRNCQNELYGAFPYLDAAFASLSFSESKATGTIGTDGQQLLYSTDFLIKTYGTRPLTVRRGYLHILLHCLYLHPFYKGIFGIRAFPDRALWNLACDMWVEYIIEKEQEGSLMLPGHPVREKCFWMMKNQPLSTERLYQMLVHNRFPFTREELERAFTFDDHRLWEKEREESMLQALMRQWASLKMRTGQKIQQHQSRAGTQRGSAAEEMEAVRSERFDYRRYLSRFAILREEVELDTESFDYIFYHLGMERYGNIPLIEPLEYKEVHRLEELVIAIDTSSSCSRERVQGFLEETYQILSQRENFFRKMKVYLIQCDCYVQDVKIIHSEEEWKSYSKNIKIQGRGGTDFRPVFRFIKEQQEKKEIQDLKALIYFTDGDGIYPKEKPDYETAFVFLGDAARTELVPGWAQKLVVPM